MKVFPPNPVQRFMNNAVPDIPSVFSENPVLAALPQIPGMSWHNCTPQMAGVKLRESFDAIPAPQLIEHIGHAKRFIEEHVTAYIDGKLPDLVRKFKYAADVLRIIQYAARIVATLNFLESLLRKEVALANAWAAECDAILAFGEATLTPAGLRNQAEQLRAQRIAFARQKIAQQIAENTSHIDCLI